MDYSLVVGVDAEKKELVVGVVDYIRTFTWFVPSIAPLTTGIRRSSPGLRTLAVEVVGSQLSLRHCSTASGSGQQWTSTTSLLSPTGGAWPAQKRARGKTRIPEHKDCNRS